MFNDIEKLVQNVTGGNTDPQAVEDAANEHVGSMDADELSGHLQTAAANLRQTGEGDAAQEIEAMVARKQVDPEALKSAAVSYIKNNPQVLARFAPSFAQGILGKLGM